MSIYLYIFIMTISVLFVVLAAVNACLKSNDRLFDAIKKLKQTKVSNTNTDELSWKPSKEQMELIDYKIQKNGIWIPRNELKRMINESYKAALDASKEKDPAMQSNMLKCEGCALTWMHILSKMSKEE